jgi:hypothetical protein
MPSAALSGLDLLPDGPFDRPSLTEPLRLKRDADRPRRNRDTHWSPGPAGRAPQRVSPSHQPRRPAGPKSWLRAVGSGEDEVLDGYLLGEVPSASIVLIPILGTAAQSIPLAGRILSERAAAA